MPRGELGLSLLSAMITPAVLISACGTLIFSTSTRLARVVDRVRVLSAQIERLFTQPAVQFGEERRRQLDVQLGFYARRARMVQASLTSFYVSLGLFVATTISIGLTPFLPMTGWVPSALGIAGTVALFIGCVLLINETRLALQSLASETEFSVQLAALYQANRGGPDQAQTLRTIEQLGERVEQEFPRARHSR